MSQHEQHQQTRDVTPLTPPLEDHVIANHIENWLYDVLYPMREDVAQRLAGSSLDLYYIQIQEDLNTAILLAEGERGKPEVDPAVNTQLSLLYKKMYWCVEQSRAIKEQMNQSSEEESHSSTAHMPIEGEIFPASDDHFIVGEPTKLQ